MYDLVYLVFITDVKMIMVNINVSAYGLFRPTVDIVNKNIRENDIYGIRL